MLVKGLVGDLYHKSPNDYWTTVRHDATAADSSLAQASGKRVWTSEEKVIVISIISIEDMNLGESLARRFVQTSFDASNQ